MPAVLRLNPWASEYEGALQFPGEDAVDSDPVHGLRLDVETAFEDWRPVEPGGIVPDRLVFVDGVRRVEVGVVQEEEQKVRYGLFGSYAAGAVVCEPQRASIDQKWVHRRVIIGGGGGSQPGLMISAGSVPLYFEEQAIDPNTPGAPLAGLQLLMRTLESELARRYTSSGHVAFVDGPLTYLLPLEEPILGYVKTLYRRYLPDGLFPVLYELQAGQRTPIFAFEEGSAARYSWYLRLARPGSLDYGLAGIVRIEVSTSVGDAEAMRLAGLSAAALPRLASHPSWDARAPQNLYPIGALENELHHALGSHLWIRRAIEGHLIRQGVAP